MCWLWYLCSVTVSSFTSQNALQLCVCWGLNQNGFTEILIFINKALWPCSWLSGWKTAGWTNGNILRSNFWTPDGCSVVKISFFSNRKLPTNNMVYISVQKYSEKEFSTTYWPNAQTVNYDQLRKHQGQTNKNTSYCIINRLPCLYNLPIDVGNKAALYCKGS